MQSELEVMAYNQQDNPTTTTTRIRKSIVAIFQELHLIEKLNIAADDAHKAWIVAQRLEKRQLRSKAAELAALKMEVSEE